MENQPIARLTFTCNRNWDDMVPVKNGRFCNDCQKKVVDFTDKTNDEIAAYLMGSTTKVCGRFQQLQLASPLPKPLWKRWLSAAAVFVTVFIGIKEASAQTAVVNTKIDSLQHKDKGQKDMKDCCNVPRKANEPYSFGTVEVLPHFPGGEKAFDEFLNQNLQVPKNVSGRVIATFVVEKNGSLTNIKIVRSLGEEADAEAIRILKAGPKWQPGTQLGKPVRTAYTMPINFQN
ncbi:MAG: energy transducer TonB [Janthinobacterium lividum]